ncbi:MAG: hypothetical protein KatS3mg052_2381 [Candidatus Roseilinea sp.]|nr:MAG: hypothetical protein KatS3mg052_0001 [Candidatus Roseilinea sp.]GIV85374.1 MAG: hypothetical protein KatS3mg052_2381 [Candidatus Roseilinea sp.]
MNAKTKGRQLRESRHVKVARIIYAQAQAAFPRYSHRFSPKKFTLPQLATCVLLSFYFKMSYRDFEELLLMSQELRDALELTAVPDYSTLNRMYHRFRASHLDKMNEALLRALDNGGLVQEDAITLDSTLFSPDECQRLLSDPPRQAVQTLVERRVCRRCQQPDDPGRGAWRRAEQRRAALVHAQAARRAVWQT